MTTVWAIRKTVRCFEAANGRVPGNLANLRSDSTNSTRRLLARLDRFEGALGGVLQVAIFIVARNLFQGRYALFRSHNCQNRYHGMPYPAVIIAQVFQRWLLRPNGGRSPNNRLLPDQPSFKRVTALRRRVSSPQMQWRLNFTSDQC